MVSLKCMTRGIFDWGYGWAVNIFWFDLVRLGATEAGWSNGGTESLIFDRSGLIADWHDLARLGWTRRVGDGQI